MWEKKPPTTLGGPKAAAEGARSYPDITKAYRKAKTLGAGDLLDWADGSLSSIGRNITDHRRNPGSGDLLRAALSDAAGLYAVLQAAVDAQPNLGKPGGPLPVSSSLGVAAFRTG